MSEPVTNVEIEDVLSSIRRLVSEDVTPKPSEPEDQKAEESTNVKLVLTPDFRIVDDAPESEPAQELVVDTNETPFDPDANAPRTPSLESRIADLEATLGDQPSNWEPDGSSFSEDQDAEQMISENAYSWHDEAALETVETQQKNAAAEEEFEAAIESRSHKPESEISPEHEAIPFPKAETQTPDAEFVSEAPINADFPNDEEPVDFYANDAVIDEDTLRDMVSEIVREELQGALGERITRNVRKLVRREINRVLSNQDFE